MMEEPPETGYREPPRRRGLKAAHYVALAVAVLVVVAIVLGAR